MGACEVTAIVSNILELDGFWAAKNIAASFGTSLHSPGKQSPGLFSDPAQTRRICLGKASPAQ